MNPYLVSWLRFNDASNIAKDECGNTWKNQALVTTYENSRVGDPVVTTTEASQGIIKNFLSEAEYIGGQDFTADFWAFFRSADAGYWQTMLNFYPADDYYNNLRFETTGTGTSLYIRRALAQNNVLLERPIACNLLDAWHHLEMDYLHEQQQLLIFADGVKLQTFSLSLARIFARVWFLHSHAGGKPKGYFDELRIFDGIALHTENFTPPTTEADYDLTELSFSVFMPATRSIIKPIDELANVKRTVNKTADEFSDLASRVVRSENIFSNVNRTVDKSADEFANVKREVNVSTVNDFSTIRRTVNVDDNFANVNRTVNFSTENFSATKRGVVFSEEYDFQPQRRLTNLADEFAPVRRLVHEPQVVDVYTRRRLTNLDDNFADVRRKILSTTDNAVNLNRAVIFTADNFSPTKRTVNKTATESANVKRQILFSADNDLPSVRRVINADENFANVTSNIIKTADNFSPTKRETLRSEICYVETSRRAELLTVIVALKNQQGNILGRIRFQKDKTSSIGHLVTIFNGINFYAGLVEVDSPNASKFRVNANGNIYSLKEEFL